MCTGLTQKFRINNRVLPNNPYEQLNVLRSKFQLNCCILSQLTCVACVGNEESPNSLMAIIGTKHSLCPGPGVTRLPGLTRPMLRVTLINWRTQGSGHSGIDKQSNSKKWSCCMLQKCTYNSKYHVHVMQFQSSFLNFSLLQQFLLIQFWFFRLHSLFQKRDDMYLRILH